MDPKFAGKPIPASPYSNYGRPDIDQMPETPNRAPHHRRTQSETSFRFTDDDIFLDDVVADFNFASIDLPSLSSDAPIPTANDDANSKSRAKKPANFGTHLRSLSVDSNFFDELGHSNSMDGSAATSFEEDSVMVMLDNSKKAIGPDRLAELSLIDPKRAKRILANRQSAARSKERKVKYTSQLEKKVQTLQTEATTLSAQVTKLERETTGLTSENKELKLRLEAMEQHALLRDALNEALREEVNRLKLEAGQLPPNNRMYYNTSLPPHHRQPLQHFADPNSQQPQPQPQKTQMPTSVPISQLKPSFMDFN
ncbi:hypothetical protein SSX86_007426 [Deinandra increscens subsp. villosa]|uniref:BZIP domain-containing protein n=1 Tax=Deinandra increscens subsp. villosa TaxID=3103831 RepID=A0AAP0DL56_9ASTR